MGGTKWNTVLWNVKMIQLIKPFFGIYFLFLFRQKQNYLSSDNFPGMMDGRMQPNLCVHYTLAPFFPPPASHRTSASSSCSESSWSICTRLLWQQRGIWQGPVKDGRCHPAKCLPADRRGEPRRRRENERGNSWTSAHRSSIFHLRLVATGGGTAAEVQGETPSKVLPWLWRRLKGRHGVPLQDEPTEDVQRGIFSMISSV